MENLNKKLIGKAASLAKQVQHSHNCKSGDVGCALISEKGRLFIGKNIQSDTGIGLCAEQSAIAAMMGIGETKIRKIVAVGHNGKVVPPCGKCREFIYQINNDNLDTDILISKDKTMKLSKLLPNRWQDIYFN